VTLAGLFSGSIDFGGGSLVSEGGRDFFVARFDDGGNHLWSHRFGNSGASELMGFDAAVQPTGETVLIGTIEGAVDLGGGNLPGSSGVDVIVWKLDADGNHVWSERFGDNNIQYGRKIAFDASGNVVIAGSFRGTLDFGNGVVLNSPSMDDAYVAKLSSTGQPHWAWQFASMATGGVYDLAINSNGQVYATGMFAGTVNFGSGPVSSEGIDTFVVWLDNNGGLVAGRRYGGPDTQYPSAIALSSAGDVWLAGYFRHSIKFGPDTLGSVDGYDIYLAKLTANLGTWFASSFGGTGDQQSAGMAVDGNDDVLLVGKFEDYLSFPTLSLISYGGTEGFVAKFDGSGAMISAHAYGDASDQAVVDVAADVQQYAVIAGNFAGSLNFPFTQISSAGGDDVFVARFAP